DHGHTRQVEAKDGPALTCQGAPPAILRLAHPGAGQPSFELEGQGSRVIMDGDPEHHFLSPGRPASATAAPPSMNTSSCWPTETGCPARSMAHSPWSTRVSTRSVFSPVSDFLGTTSGSTRTKRIVSS